jgi:hypothetical protein
MEYLTLWQFVREGTGLGMGPEKALLNCRVVLQESIRHFLGTRHKNISVTSCVKFPTFRRTA